MAKERRAEAAKEFEGVAKEAEADDDIDWMQRLDLHSKTGAVKPTIDNTLIILDHDPLLKGRFALLNPYSAVVTGITFTSCPACLKISRAKSYQLMYPPSLVA